MSTSAGSYDFGAFSGNEAELERLKRQAAIGLDLERAIWKRLGLGAGMEVLDLACGPGIVSCELARLVAPGRVLGVDLSEALLDGARAYQRAEGVENVSFRQADVYALDLPEGAFDFVYARFLFQHLAEPPRALEQIRRVLKPGGILCAVDVDDEWLAVYPKLEAFAAFTAAAAAGQASRGGDRHVGHKLAGYFQDAGFSDARVGVEVVTSFQIGFRNFLDLTTHFKLEQVPEEGREQAARELEEVYSLLENPQAWGAVGIFAATARKGG